MQLKLLLFVNKNFEDIHLSKINYPTVELPSKVIVAAFSSNVPFVLGEHSIESHFTISK